MIFSYNRVSPEPLLEVTRQCIPRSPEQLPQLACSRPLHELATKAPGQLSFSPADRVEFPFSNDAVASYLSQLTARTQTKDYRTATNRVAVLVGESSLASALPYMPEETIVLLDISAPMCRYMNEYVTVLRTATCLEDWQERMQCGHPELYYSQELQRQIAHWGSEGQPHSFASPAAFAVAQYHARNKAIITWQADIFSKQKMAKLGDSLREASAHVTFMNLTNVIDACRPNGTPAGVHATLQACVAQLGQLPFTKDAPLITTSSIASELRPTSQRPLANLAQGVTGPYFGLEDLARSGSGLRTATIGSVICREYFTA